jgi:hypothetical protein
MTILACDLGGTRMKIGLVRDGRVLFQTVKPAHSKKGLAPQLPVLKAAWLSLLGEAGLGLADCAGVTVAFPSLVNPATGPSSPTTASIPMPRTWICARGRAGARAAAGHRERRAHGLHRQWRFGAGQGLEQIW